MEKENGKKNQLIKITKIIIINTTDIMKWTKNMDTGNLFGNQETNIKVTIIMMKDKDLVQWNGQMVVCIKDTGLKEFSMGLV
jgi:hypothetical protein